MKELSIEEKAKCYDEAINKLRRFMARGVDPLITRADVQDFFPELAESEDERIRKTLIKHFEEKLQNGYEWAGIPVNSILTWLEKQGEHYNFRQKIQVGDQVTRNEDGVLVNLSQLKRVAKPAEKQGEQKHVEWSEEDEKLYQSALWHIKNSCGNQGKTSGEYEVYNFVKFLKDRCLPQQQEWSKDDEQYLLVCKNALARYQITDKWDAHIISHWLEDKLKSLRPQKHL